MGGNYVLGLIPSPGSVLVHKLEKNYGMRAKNVHCAEIKQNRQKRQIKVRMLMISVMICPRREKIRSRLLLPSYKQALN